MSSSSEFAAGPGAPTATEDSGGDEPEASKVDVGFDDLRRESAAMLRTLADKYDAESEESRARSAQLLAESEAAGALAVKLGEESVRIRTEADRLASQPTWLSGVPDATAESKAEPQATPDAGPTAGTTGTSTTEPGTTAPPGPGPARGFAPNVGASSEGSQLSSPSSAPTSAASSTSSSVQGGTSGQGSPAPPTGESDDWAPRPFESWRNQASQVTPRLLEL